MGLSLALPECNIPQRFLLGLDNADSILRECATHRVAYAWGILLVVTVGLAIGASLTQDAAPGRFRIPWWVVILPILLGLLHTMTVYGGLGSSFQTEALEHRLSGMSKRDYLNYKVGDDRTSRSAAASATSAGVLAGSNLLGPFLRADR